MYWTLCQRNIPADEERYSYSEKKGKIVQASSVELFCLFRVADYIDGFGHSQPDLDLSLLKSNSSGTCKGKFSMDKGNIHAQDQPQRAQNHTAIQQTTHTQILLLAIAPK